MEQIKNKTDGAISSLRQAEELIDTRELARRLKVSTKTIRNWRQQNVIPFFQIKRAVRFDWDEVTQVLYQNNHREAA